MRIIYGWVLLPFLRIDRMIFRDGMGDDFVWMWGWNYLTRKDISKLNFESKTNQ